MFRIRRFVEGDEETYVRIHNDGYSTEKWFGTLAKPVTREEVSELSYDATFLAELDGQTIGLIDIRSYGHEFHIENLVVLQNFRGKGVGTKLLKKAIDYSKSRGIKRIQAETPIGNSRFYEKNGFRFMKYAFLVLIEDKEAVEPFLNTKLYFEGQNQYWVPGEEEMQFIRELGVDFKEVGKFKVVVRNV